MKPKCSERLWRHINREIKNHYENIYEETKVKHSRKLGELQTKDCNGNKPINPTWVVNMSSKNLSESELKVLTKGLNFAPASRKIPVDKFITEVESSISKLNSQDKLVVRNKVTNILASAKLPTDNMSREERRALKTLRDDKSIIILRADKGNSTVVMDRTKYDSKINNMLCDTKTYQVLPKDPATCETKLNSILSTMK